MKHPIPLEFREWYLSRNHIKILEDYIPHHYPGPITLLRGPARNESLYNDPELGWKDIARGRLRIVIIPASHGTFVEAKELGVQFAKELKAAQELI